MIKETVDEGIQLQMVTPDSNLVQLSETVCTVRDSLQAKNNKPIMRQNLVNLVTVTYVTSIKGMDTGLVLENKEAQVKQTQQENQDVLMRPKWRRLSRGVTKQRRMGGNRNKFGKHGHDAWPEFSHATLKKARTSAESEDGICFTVRDYFSKKLQTSVPSGKIHAELDHSILPCVTRDMNRILDDDFSGDEARVAIFQMYPTKAPGIDGMPVLFYQKY
ncbi:hypothetical protein JRO89_XS03G0112300 [Xanthoceras sorbifolium]|uniref:Reverse transcriptase n=1 Tax=Xanthoceras sorbifolium TaxID=99658 RepID=A0ABQ8I9I3_9ROSI|nr:hypothetical protein JRO89_XS03G0112300 [Xanthoceras sorbifolium]